MPEQQRDVDPAEPPAPDPKWREAGSTWARRAPEEEVERLIGHTDEQALTVRRTDLPSLYLELTTELEQVGEDPELTFPPGLWLRDFIDGARSVWQETHG